MIDDRVLLQTATLTAAVVPDQGVLAFHRSLDGYRPTPVHHLQAEARRLGLRDVIVKDESDRLGLPAFKVLGSSWAAHRLLEGVDGPVTLVAATAGNHGRAVARVARLLGQRAHIYVAADIQQYRADAIEGEGAELTRVPGTYDDAVEAAIESITPGRMLLADVARNEDDPVPGLVVEGYSTLFAELDEQVVERPQAVLVPVGVGSLLAAAVNHYAGSATAVVCVEPAVSACAMASARAGHPVTILPSGGTLMPVLDGQQVSLTAWPAIDRGTSAFAAVTEDEAAAALHDLHALDIQVGYAGAAPLAALRLLLEGENGAAARAHLGLSSNATVVLLATEGSPPSVG